MAVPVIAESEVMCGKSIRTQTCGMEYNASVVKAMTSTLYHHKKRAVVREYATNITDSHSDAGIPLKAGYVHVPTKLNPVIEFHDSGVGLSEDDVYDIYTVLGRSTKRNDNRTNGNLGFGSKAYAAVADQMTVTSVKEGVKIVVLCYKNKYGELAADLKSKTQSAEQNGTIVSIPVNPSDIDEWQMITANVLGAFRVPHTVNTFGDYKDTFNEVHNLCNKVRNNGSVFLQNVDNELEYYISGKMVLMGDVLYDLPEFTTLIGNTGIKGVVKSFADNGLYLTNFNIGDLDFAPSRESISYDSKTLIKVKRRVNGDIKKFYREFIKDIDVGCSFYKFYHQYKYTSVWTALEGVALPFTKNHKLIHVDPSRKDSWGYSRVRFLSDEDTFGSIRGVIPSVVGYNVFSHSVGTLSQDRLVNIKNPTVVYSNKDNGLYKMKETLSTISENYGGGHVLYTESEGKAKNIARWFGVDTLICGDSYSPERNKRNVVSTKRESYGITSDMETVATYLTVTSDGDYTQGTGKVDLSEKGLYYVDKEEDVVVKGIVPKHEVRFYKSPKTLCNMLKIVGGNKVIIRNLNNKGKIERAGIKPLSISVESEIKTIKPELTKYLAQRHFNHNGFTDIEMVLIENKPTLNNMKIKLDEVDSFCEKVELAAGLSKFFLDKTKSFEKYSNGKIKIYNKLTGDVNSIMEKLPLADKFSYYETEDFKYYLKLEKVIK